MSDHCRSDKVLRISWSNLQHHELCAQRAKLIRQRKKSPADDVRNFFHGTVSDRVMRSWLSDPSPVPGVMPGMVEEYISVCLDDLKAEESGVVRWRSRTDRSELLKFCQTLVTRLEPYLIRDVLPYDYAPEHRFRVPFRIPYLDGTPTEIELVGGIDVLVCRSENHWVVFDLKATANPDYIRKTLGQGIFYDISILASFGHSPKEVGFWQPMVTERPYVSANVTNEDRRSMLSRIVNVAHDRWRGEDSPKLSAAGCAWCPVKGSCTKFSTQSTSPFRPVRASAR